MTARTSFFGSHRGHRRIRRPAYFSPARRRPPTQQPRERRDDHEDRERREEHREPGGEQRGALGVERQRAGGLGVEARADAAEQRARGGEAERGGSGADDDAGGHQRGRGRRSSRRASSAPSTSESASSSAHDRTGVARRPRAAVDEPSTRDQHEDREQERPLLEEREVGAVEVEAEVGRRRARRRAASAGTGGSRSPRRCRAPWRRSRRKSMAALAFDQRRMTIDETPQGAPARTRSSATAGCSRAHAGDDVLGDARPDGRHRAARGHLARRRPAGHDDVPGRGLRGADGARGRRPSRARRSSTGRPRASTTSRSCIVQVMAAEGMEVEPDDLLVTTGGQQVIDLVCKTLLDPGDVVIAEAPTYPGAVPCFTSYQADVVQIEMDDDGMRIDVLEDDARRGSTARAAAEVHLHDPDLPEPGRRDDVARAPARARADRARARAAGARGQPVRAAALRGRPAADAVLARRRRAT